MDDNLRASEEAVGTLSPEEITALQERVVENLRGVYDPEIPVNIYELGLIYKLEVTPSGFVRVEMTLTSPGCPVAGSLPGEVKQQVLRAEGVTGAEVELVWDPPWSMDQMSETAKLELGFL